MIGRRVGLVVVLAVLAGGGPGQPASSAPVGAAPTPEDLGVTPGRTSSPRAINEKGQVLIQEIDPSQIVPWGYVTDSYLWTREGGSERIPGTPGRISATALSENGQVVGVSDFDTSPSLGFSWTHEGGFKSIEALSYGGDIVPFAVNGTGLVVGAERGGRWAFKWTESSGSVWLVPPTTLTSTARGVNDAGTVVGKAQGVLPFDPVCGYPKRAFVWGADGSATPLGLDPPCNSGGFESSSEADFINASGQVAGQSTANGGTESHAFSWTAAGGIIDIGTLGGTYSEAGGLNDQGQVVGCSSLPGDAEWHPFIWSENDGIKDLDSLGGSYACAVAINENGQVVGFGNLADDTAQHAFLWTKDDGLIDLGTLGGSNSAATDINDNGQIVGTSDVTGDTESHAVLWESDTDGDGLPDAWETNGVTVDGEFLDLPAMGADPLHKDVFVEVDALAGHELSQAAIEIVVDSFARAPVDNPDKSVGISLHVDNGPLSTMDPMTGSTWGALSDSETLPHVEMLGSMDGAEYRWDAFDLLKNAHFKQSRRVAFHYAIGAHVAAVAAGGWPSGIARDIPGSDFIVSLGLTCLPPAECNGSVDEQAGTFMHELGHTLGLHHGGDDDLNDKPNYLSVMNYTFQFPGLSHGMEPDIPRYDYSRYGPTDLGSLAENDLNELIGFPTTNSIVVAYISGYRCPDGTKVTSIVDDKVDWNCNKTTTPGFETHVRADLNADGTHDTLNPFEDWSHLIYTGDGSIGQLGATVEPPAETTVDEATIEELLNWEALFDTPADDTTPPAVTVPADVTAEAAGPDGAAVEFTATAHDAVDGDLAAACAPASGSTFPLGETTVACEATDTHGNTGHASFKVTVEDTTAPVVTVPADVTAQATGADGRTVDFTATAHDAVDGDLAAACTPASGSTFPVGETTVACEATDAHGNTGHASFEVTVTASSSDTTPPVLTLPGSITTDATGPGGALVVFFASALDAVDGTRPVTCTPPSLTLFAIGDTTVTCSAADTQGNTAHGAFTVHVRGAGEQLAALRAAVAAADPPLKKGLAKDLLKKLDEAARELSKGKTKQACHKLDEFADKVAAAAKKHKLGAAVAADWIRRAEQIREALGS